MASLEDILDTLRSYMAYTNMAKNPSKYIDPKVKVGYDANTEYAGYAPNTDLKSIVLNPKASGGMLGYADTYAHEMAHTDQNHFLRTLNGRFGTPGWQMGGIDFPYYGPIDGPEPPNIEKLATLRAAEAMAAHGKRWWETSIGKDTLEQLKAKHLLGRNRAGYSENQIKNSLEAVLYPQQNKGYIKGPQGK